MESPITPEREVSIDFFQSVIDKIEESPKTDLDEVEEKLRKLKVEYDGKGINITRAIDNLWKYCRRQIAGPGFLINVPVYMEPLAKRKSDDQNIVERFQEDFKKTWIGGGGQ